jgi:hypothetical protein
VDNFCFFRRLYHHTLVSQKRRAHLFDNVQREKHLLNPYKTIIFKQIVLLKTAFFFFIGTKNHPFECKRAGFYVRVKTKTNSN